MVDPIVKEYAHDVEGLVVGIGDVLSPHAADTISSNVAAPNRKRIDTSH
jgi:hypothetical protein